MSSKPTPEELERRIDTAWKAYWKSVDKDGLRGSHKVFEHLRSLIQQRPSAYDSHKMASELKAKKL